MKKYKLLFSETFSYEIEIEANSLEEAIVKLEDGDVDSDEYVQPISYGVKGDYIDGSFEISNMEVLKEINDED